jgi:hypothetical protein
MIADDFYFFLSAFWGKKFSAFSWNSFTNSSSNPLQKTCCGIPEAVSDSKNVSKAPYRILKIVPKSACDMYTRENRQMLSEPFLKIGRFFL